MRVNKWGVGLVLAASVLLTGCTAGAEEPTDPKPSAAAEETTAPAPASDCPELSEGATVDGAALGPCISDAMQDTAGYTAKTTLLGMETNARYNPQNKAVETTTPMGSLIVIGDDAWVKSSTSDWQVADPNSSDPIIAALSSGAVAAASTDPAETAGALTGDFTVTGTGTRLGQEVYIVSGTSAAQGVDVDVTFEVTKDYVVLATSGTTEAAGQSIESSLEITEWDVAQDIVAPL
ncbi:hypothetical protein DXT68_16550 [Microbacterium foliorum]|uniref:LppX_LprAFG lipoprotein n=1 Tax=Microbacterium foliorum TaxID=104336 RepID=A0A0F0KLC2_9MICO|nr:hypothetical protein [Microbacterium foliorum]AXL13554.1 hypothetical protein DXT68_16550 [Microbacterium foliorum]KJL21672.1 hypothetical protein RN50_01570 [Microbacterium foliorum]